MNVDETKLQQLRQLIDWSLEGTISAEQIRRLEQFINESSDYLGYYCEYLSMSVGIEQFYSRSSIPTLMLEHCSDVFWSELAEEERNAPAIQMKKEVEICVQTGDVELPRKGRIRKTALSFALISMAALLMLIAYVQNVPCKTSTAVVSNVLNPVWHHAKDRIVPGEWLYNTDSQRFLTSGTIQLEFLSGVKAIIEGPAEFAVVTDDQVKLSLGKIYATVPPEAAGFAVRTPSAKIIDLGTEFGVETGTHGNTEVHVFRGSTMLMAGGDRQESYIETITSGFARAVSPGGVKVQDISIREDKFVRAVDMKKSIAWRSHRLNLADFAGGGNGLGTGQIDYGIMVDSGSVSSGPLLVTGHGQNTVESNIFRTVPQISAIDGIFVPDGGSGPVVISSRGDTFSACPDTNGSWSPPIINGARCDFSPEGRRLEFDGETFGTPENPALFLHANIGITYDLSSIRNDLPEGISPYRFVALAAAPMNMYEYKESHFDIWVLVDGQVRFSKTMMAPHQSFPVNIALTEQDRFLSIVVTDGIEDQSGAIPKNHCDWCLLGRPELVLQMN